MTPLIIASHDGRSCVVSILLRSGADVNLAVNVSKGNAQVVTVLCTTIKFCSSTKGINSIFVNNKHCQLI